jgi:hypothetical protein
LIARVSPVTVYSLLRLLVVFFFASVRIPHLQLLAGSPRPGSPRAGASPSPGLLLRFRKNTTSQLPSIRFSISWSSSSSLP